MATNPAVISRQVTEGSISLLVNNVLEENTFTSLSADQVSFASLLKASLLPATSNAGAFSYVTDAAGAKPAVLVYSNGTAWLDVHANAAV